MSNESTKRIRDPNEEELHMEQDNDHISSRHEAITIHHSVSQRPPLDDEERLTIWDYFEIRRIEQQAAHHNLQRGLNKILTMLQELQTQFQHNEANTEHNKDANQNNHQIKAQNRDTNNHFQQL